MCKKLVLCYFLMCQIINIARSNHVQTSNFEETLKQCLVSYGKTELGTCMAVGAIKKLQTIDANPNFDLIDGLTFTKDMTSQEYRDNSYNYAEQDPSDIRSLIGTFDHVFGKRLMRWDMGFLYPGLKMHVSPAYSPGGTLEFVLDPGWENADVNRVKTVGTGRLLAKQFLLPFLLGFKFNLVTLIPIVIGALILLVKKAVFLSKLALIISSAFGLSTLLFHKGYGGYESQHYGGGDYVTSDHYYEVSPHYHHSSYGSHYRGLPSDENSQSNYLPYREISAPENGEQMQDIKYYRNSPEYIDQVDREEKKKKTGRNFAWSEDEKQQNVNTAR